MKIKIVNARGTWLVSGENLPECLNTWVTEYPEEAYHTIVVHTLIAKDEE